MLRDGYIHYLDGKNREKNKRTLHNDPSCACTWPQRIELWEEQLIEQQREIADSTTRVGDFDSPL